MLAARVRLATRPVLTTAQRRSVLTVPRWGTEESMKAEAIEQLRARVAAQKALVGETHKSHEEELDEMYKWIKITFFIGAPICALSMAKDIIFADHPHAHEGDLPDYMKIRSKAFPWECEDCDLFDLPCWKKCRAEKE